jgi:hypothetical protein
VKGDKGDIGPTGPPGLPGEKGARGKRGKRVRAHDSESALPGFTPCLPFYLLQDQFYKTNLMHPFLRMETKLTKSHSSTA